MRVMSSMCIICQKDEVAIISKHAFNATSCIVSENSFNTFEAAPFDDTAIYFRYSSTHRQFTAHRDRTISLSTMQHTLLQT